MNPVGVSVFCIILHIFIILAFSIKTCLLWINFKTFGGKPEGPEVISINSWSLKRNVGSAIGLVLHWLIFKSYLKYLAEYCLNITVNKKKGPYFFPWYPKTCTTVKISIFFKITQIHIIHISYYKKLKRRRFTSPSSNILQYLTFIQRKYHE